MASALSARTFVLACGMLSLMPGCPAEQAPPAQTQSGVKRDAAAGDPDALAEIGRTHMTGASGYPIDRERARELFQLAAQKGSGSGLLYLGLLAHSEGDSKEACALFKQSAGRNHPGGLREYGNCRLHGVGGVPRDAREAAVLYRESIARGGIDAYAQLALLYRHGAGVAKDEREADRLLKEGAEKGCKACLADLTAGRNEK